MADAFRRWRVEKNAREQRFIHVCENGDVHALREEVGALARDAAVTTRFAYHTPTAEDREQKYSIPRLSPRRKKWPC